MARRQDLEEIEDDFVLLELASPTTPTPLPTPPTTSTKARVTLQPVGGGSNDILLSIIPPSQPHGDIRHTPCDIVLVIDVSGSMNAAAELPDQAGNHKKEASGLSILDLVKHAARTILQKLDERDRLAVVTFSNTARVIQGLLPMTDVEKTATWKRIEELTVHDSTNLWSGIREALTLFEDTERRGNAQGMFVLTDGVPNHMCPSQGYVRKLQPMLQKMRQERGDAPLISCFGFGYHLRSALLRSIAEVGRGHYAFIPDAGMIGTVFVHAVANIFSTFATSAEVALSCSNAKVTIDLPSWLEFDAEAQVIDTRVLHIGGIQYGQSRDIIVKLNGASRKDSITATVRCRVPNQPKQMATSKCHLSDKPAIPQTAIDYHVSRHDLCAYLASLSTKNVNNEHAPLPTNSVHTKSLAIDALIELIRSRITSAKSIDPSADTADLAAVLADLQSSNPTDPHGSGQIALAVQIDKPNPSPPSTSPDAGQHSQHYAYSYRVQTPSYYQRWGMHYLPSILHAHMRQICTTFKDPGPLRYGMNSPLFVKMRDELDDAFDKLPAPKGSLNRRGNGAHHTPVRMSRYNSYSNPCFAPECRVRMGDGQSFRKVGDLRIGDIVRTLSGGRSVRGIVVTPIDRVGGGFQEMCHISDERYGDHADGAEPGLWITPYHPIYHASTGRWVFPRDIAKSTKVMQSGAVYSILLEPDDNINAHTVEVGGVTCATLGHGLTQAYAEFPATSQAEAPSQHSGGAEYRNKPQEVDVRAHPFFGSYNRVLSSLSRLTTDESGRWISGGIVKEGTGKDSDLACGFVPLLVAHEAKELEITEAVFGRSPAKMLSRQLTLRCSL